MVPPSPQSKTQTVIIYDLEYTAWPHSRERNWSDAGEHREVVQIGAVKIDTRSLSEIDSFSVYCKPKINSALSPYFVELTEITQELVDREGVLFENAFIKFYEWAENFPLYSWGRGDDSVLKENCTLYGTPFLFSDDRFFDMRTIFTHAGIDASQYYSSTILEAFGKKSPYRGHNGLSDARTILRALRELPNPPKLF